MKPFWKPVALAVAVLLTLEGITLMTLRARLLIAIYAVVFGAMVWLRHRSLRPGDPLARLILVGFTVSVIPIGLGLLVGHENPILAVLEDLLPTLTGWLVLVALLPLRDDSPSSAPGSAWTMAPSALVPLLAGAFVLLAIAHQLAVGPYALISDEVVMLIQSRWMNFPQVAMPMAPDLAPWFIMRKVDYLDGHLYGMYPPGWPAFLAVFRYAGLEWWSSVILGTVSLALVYWLGRRLHSPRAGFLSALLLGTSQFYALTHAGYMAHAPLITLLLAASCCLMAGIDASGWRRVVAWVAAGVLLGFGVTVRPLTGLALGASIGLWMLWRAWKRHNAIPVALMACVAAGGLLPAALFVYYNTTVLGAPLAIGYDVMHPGLYSLGFGPRGFRVLDANLNWVPNAFPFRPADGIQALLRRLVGLNTTFVPVGMLLPVAVTAVAAGFRIGWGVVATFALLPIALFFYWYGGLRLYSELLPFVLLATAVMLVTIHARWPRLGKALTGMVVLSHLIVALPTTGGINNGHRPWAPSDYGPFAPARRITIQTADSLAREHGKLLLFSREATRFDNQIDRLYVFNGRFNGRIMVARDRGAKNAELIARFPDRIPFLVEDQGRDKIATFTRLDR